MNRFPILVLLLTCCASTTPATKRDPDGVYFTAYPPTQVEVIAPSARVQPAKPPSEFRYTNTVDLGDFDSESLIATWKAFAALSGHVQNITFRIDSAGGSIRLGQRFIRLVTDEKKLHNLRITCVVDGSAYSMAAVFLESAACDERLATPISTILFHNGSGGAEGTEQQIENGRRMLASLNQAMAAVVAQRIGLTVAAYRAHLAESDWVLAAVDAAPLHVIDAVVSTNDVAPPVTE